MRRQLPDLVLLAAFILAIALPLASPLPPLAQFREQSGAPQMDSSARQLAKTIIDFPNTFTAYFESHHLLHQQLVDLSQKIRFYLFHETVFPNVLIGKEDWLYYTGEDNIADYECAMPFTADELQLMRARLQGWHDQLAQRGIRFYVVIAPNKEAINPQYLPAYIQSRGKACRIDQVMEELETTQLAVLDLRSPMQNAARSDQVYHRTDTHWNAVGALLAAREILGMVKQDFPQTTLPSYSDYLQENLPFSGDLAAFLPKNSRFIEQAPFLTSLAAPRARLEEGAGRSILSTISGIPLPGALVFRDSFSDALIPFLSEHFSRALFVHSFSVDLDLVDREKPDLVIFELAQRYLTVLR